MTLLERVAWHQGAQVNIDERLVEAARSIPNALGLAVTSSPRGVRGMLVIDERRGSFLDAEDLAMGRLVEIRRDYPDAAIDLVCVSTRDARTIDLRSDARVYSFLPV